MEQLEDRLENANNTYDQLFSEIQESQQMFNNSRVATSASLDFPSAISNYRARLVDYCARNNAIMHGLQNILINLNGQIHTSESRVTADFRLRIADLNSKLYINIGILTQKIRYLDENRALLILERQQFPSVRAHRYTNLPSIPLEEQLNPIHQRFTRQQFERVRESFQNVSTYIQKLQERSCRCEKDLCQINAHSIECGICFEEMVDGIRPECCDCKQSICLSCLFITICEQYKTITKKNAEDVCLSELLTLHYSCNFCRKISCYKKYEFLLNPTE